jgi:hypothetical protein
MKTIEEREDYLFVEYDGSTNSTALISLMEEIARVCRDKKLKKVLADMRKTAETLDLTQRYELGVTGANILRGLQIAVVYHTDENNSFAESVAVNRGLQAMITDDMESAKRWLGLE